MRFTRVLMAIGLAASLTACGGSSGESKFDCVVDVFAASSFSAALMEMKSEMQDIAGCEVTFKFGSSGSLAASIVSGAQPDFFLSSGTGALETAGLDSSAAHALVDSHLAVITLMGSNAESDVTTVKDLLDTQWKLGLCSESAPCGELADLVLMNAIDAYGEEFDFSRESLADTEAISSSDLMTKLQMEELDVVLGYASSCATNKRLMCTPIPDSVDGRRLGEKTTYYVSAVGTSEGSLKLKEYLYSFKFPNRLIADFGFEKLS